MLLDWLRPKVSLDVHMPALERDDWDALWRMYETARAESISAQQMMQQVIYWTMTAGTLLVAAVSFLRGVDELSVPKWVVPIVAWGAIFLVGWLGGTQYISEAGRMMRAGCFARKIENKLLARTGSSIEASLLWETYLAAPGNRLLAAFRISGVASILFLAMAQAVPFMVFDDHGPLGKCKWLLFPAVGIPVILVSVYLQYRHYKSQFPAR